MDQPGQQELLITVKGHPNISATHKTTWQITTESHLTSKGDCIVGIESNIACKNLPDWLKTHLRTGGEILVELQVDELVFQGVAKGHPDLSLLDEVEMVFRKSDFISPRTIAIQSSFAANEIPVEMLELMKIPETRLNIRIIKK